MSVVESVNGKTGVVTLKATDVEAVPTGSVGAANGVASLNSSAQLPEAELPTSVVTSSTGGIDTGKPGQRRLSLIKGGVNAWVDDSNGIPLKAFGAKWDGKTDDSKALEEAIEASVELGGQPILLPFGTGVINSEPKTPIWTPSQIEKGEQVQVSIRGASMFGTVVKLPEALTFLQPKSTAAGDTVGYVDLREFTVNGNNQIASSGKGPAVVWGTTTSSRNNVNIEHFHAQRIRTINIGYEDKERSERYNFPIIVYQTAIGQSANVVQHISISEVLCYGGGMGAAVTASYEKGGSTYPLNVRAQDIYIGRLLHIIPSPATETESFCSHVLVGGAMWSDGTGIIIENCYGENSGDNGFELDIPGIIRNCVVINPNNVGFTFTAFNPSTTKEPVVTLLTAEATAGATTTLEVESSAAFEVGQRVLIGSTAASRKQSQVEVRTIESKPSGTQIKLSKAVGTTWKSKEAWVQQIDDMGAVKVKGENLAVKRTAKTPGGASGVVVQNFQSAIPMWGVDIDGIDYENNVEDMLSSTGASPKILTCQPGTENSPTGNPFSLSVTRIKANRRNLKWAEATTGEVSLITLALPQGVPDTYERSIKLFRRTPVKLQGLLRMSGPGATGSGAIKGVFMTLGGLSSSEGASVDIDLDLITQLEISQKLGAVFSCVRINSATCGDVSGRVRHRTLPSFVGTPETFKIQGVQAPAPYGLASKEVATTLTAVAAVGATTWEVESTEGFATGDVVVMDARATGTETEKNAKVEVFIVKEIKESEKKLVIVSAGENPGCAVEHAVGAAVALMRPLIVEGCDWTGLPSAYGVGITSDAAGAIFNTVKVLSSILPVPVGSERVLGGSNVLIPASGSAMQILANTGGKPSILSIFTSGPSSGPYPYYQVTIKAGTRTSGEGTLSFKWNGQTYTTGKIKFNATGEEVFAALIAAKTSEGLTLPGGAWRLTSGAANTLTSGEIVLTAAGQLTGKIESWTWGTGFSGGTAPTFVETGGTTFLAGVEWSTNGLTYYTMPLTTVGTTTVATFPISPGDFVRLKYSNTAFATGKITEKTKVLTTSAAAFESGDANLEVKASWLPSGTYIKAFKSTTEVELSAEATSTETEGTFEIVRLNGRISPQRTA